MNRSTINTLSGAIRKDDLIVVEGEDIRVQAVRPHVKPDLLTIIGQAVKDGPHGPDVTIVVRRTEGVVRVN